VFNPSLSLMTRPSVWAVIPSLAITPGKTFFGLDKQKAHCFTIDSRLHRFFEDPFFADVLGLSEYRKQTDIIFLIGERPFPAKLRRIDQDRSMTRTRKPDELPHRTIYQFQWSRGMAKKSDDTIHAIREMFEYSYRQVLSGNNKHGERAVFHHIGDNVFLLRRSKDDEDHLGTEL
jgi:hypothetical protein